MKKLEKFYFILTYLFFIYPPFIFGFVMIYRDYNYTDQHIVSLIVNIILLLLISAVCLLLIKTKKIHVPTKLETKYLLFGFAGNVVMYFYTFQNLLKVEKYVTIYLVLLIVLLVHYLLISKTFKNIELWILMVVFLVVDSLYTLFTGCTYSDNGCVLFYGGDVFTYILYIIALLSIVIYYCYHVYLLKKFDFFKIINIILLIIMSVIIQVEDLVIDEVMMTIAILIPLFIIIDFIVSFVNKVYNHKMLIFYIRTLTLFVVFTVLAETDFFRGSARPFILSIMVFATYSTLGITILNNVLKIGLADVSPLMMFKHYEEDIQYILCDGSHKESIRSEYNEMLSNHIHLEEDSYSLAAIKNHKIIGFISSYVKNLPEPLNDVKEAFLDVIEVKEEFRNQGIATNLITKSETYFRKQNIHQLRGWSTNDKIEALKLWYKLKYVISPSTIWIEEKEISISGFYFIKKLH